MGVTSGGALLRHPLHVGRVLDENLLTQFGLVGRPDAPEAPLDERVEQREYDRTDRLDEVAAIRVESRSGEDRDDTRVGVVPSDALDALASVVGRRCSPPQSAQVDWPSRSRRSFCRSGTFVVVISPIGSSSTTPTVSPSPCQWGASPSY